MNRRRVALFFAMRQIRLPNAVESQRAFAEMK
jgi:hypothetical protein